MTLADDIWNRFTSKGYTGGTYRSQLGVINPAKEMLSAMGEAISAEIELNVLTDSLELTTDDPIGTPNRVAAVSVQLSPTPQERADYLCAQNGWEREQAKDTLECVLWAYTTFLEPASVKVANSELLIYQGDAMYRFDPGGIDQAACTERILEGFRVRMPESVDTRPRTQFVEMIADDLSLVVASISGLGFRVMAPGPGPALPATLDMQFV